MSLELNYAALKSLFSNAKSDLKSYAKRWPASSGYGNRGWVLIFHPQDSTDAYSIYIPEKDLESCDRWINKLPLQQIIANNESMRCHFLSKSDKPFAISLVALESVVKQMDLEKSMKTLDNMDLEYLEFKDMDWNDPEWSSINIWNTSPCPNKSKRCHGFYAILAKSTGKQTWRLRLPTRDLSADLEQACLAAFTREIKESTLKETDLICRIPNPLTLLKRCESMSTIKGVDRVLLIRVSRTGKSYVTDAAINSAILFDAESHAGSEGFYLMISLSYTVSIKDLPARWDNPLSIYKTDSEDRRFDYDWNGENAELPSGLEITKSISSDDLDKIKLLAQLNQVMDFDKGFEPQMDLREFSEGFKVAAAIAKQDVTRAACKSCKALKAIKLEDHEIVHDNMRGIDLAEYKVILDGAFRDNGFKNSHDLNVVVRLPDGGKEPYVIYIDNVRFIPTCPSVYGDWMFNKDYAIHLTGWDW